MSENNIYLKIQMHMIQSFSLILSRREKLAYCHVGLCLCVFIVKRSDYAKKLIGSHLTDFL